MALYQFRNGIPLTTTAAANFTRGELAPVSRLDGIQWDELKPAARAIPLGRCLEFLVAALAEAWHLAHDRSFDGTRLNSELWADGVFRARSSVRGLS